MVEDEPLIIDSSEPTNDHRPEDSWEFSIDIRKVIISCFIVWQVLAVLIWLLPDRAPRASLEPFVGAYMQFTGCWQQWSMFSPNPASLDEYITADVKYADGTRRTWTFPRMSDLDYVRRYQQERFRKALENEEPDTAKTMWPFLARYAAIVNGSPNTRKYPMTIALVRHYRYITPPPWSILPFATHGFYTQTFDHDPGKASNS